MIFNYIFKIENLKNILLNLMTSNPIENAHHYLSKNINGVLHNINLNSNSF